MKNKIVYIGFLCFIAGIFFFSCKKDNYIIGGKLSNDSTNLTTYDYLKNNQYHVFDTLILLIDKAGMEQTINQKGITFFAFTDHSINNYLQFKTAEVQNVDPFQQYNIDTLIKYDLDVFKDSLEAYIIPSRIDYGQLTENGSLFETAMDSTWAAISFETTYDPNLGYTSTVSIAPRVEWFTIIKNKAAVPFSFSAAQLPDSVGIHTLCQTSGIHTSTGILNVLSNSHAMYFRTR